MIGAPVAAVPSISERVSGRERARSLEDAVDRLECSLDSEDTADGERVAGLTAVVNGRVALLNATSRGGRGMR